MCYLPITTTVAILLLPLISTVGSHWTQHHRYQHQKGAESRWKKRQTDPVGKQHEIELNVTVPYIFSARLYPYGESKGDSLLEPSSYAQPHVLKTEMSYFEEKITAIYVTRDGAIGFSPDLRDVDKSRFPRGPKIIAPFWTPVSLGDTGRVYFRESKDDSIINLAASEVQIQYRYPSSFRPKSVFIATWENVAPPAAPKDLPTTQRNLFQIALILSGNGTFAHIIYSKLRWHNNATAGFNEGNGNGYFVLPGSGAANVRRLANDSDIGIPGEWLFRIDTPNIYLCGPGFKGIECIHKCDPGEWGFDCVHRCHCANKANCNTESGTCPNGKCGNGWTNPPVCDIDLDECEDKDAANNLCKNDSPDCINTPGSYICGCLSGFGNSSNSRCGGGSAPGARIEVVPHQPEVVFINPPRGRINAVSPTILPKTASSPSTVFSSPEVPTVSTSVEPQSTTLLKSTESQSKTTGFATTPVEITFGRQPTPTVAIPKENLTSLASTASTTDQPVNFNTSHNCTQRCGTNAHCTVGPDGNPTCLCDRGFSGDGLYCVDINECFSGNMCGSSAKCLNNDGSYQCVCEEGYRFSDDKQCIDIDECATGQAKCSNGGNTSVCVNRNGTYECRCQLGFNGNPSNPQGCVDINECLTPDHYCGVNADCQNTFGGYFCTCTKGFKLNKDASGCEAADTCKNATCSPNARCTSTGGSFICTCNEGFAGDGVSCLESTMFQFSRISDQKLPVHQDSVQQLILSRPIMVLGKGYDSVYVSANGLLTMDGPVQYYRKDVLGQLNLMGLAPLYHRVDMNRSAGIYVKEYTDIASLTRGSLNVQDYFNDPNFIADSVIVVTYDSVVEEGQPDATKSSTYQTVIAGGREGTFAMFIYENVSVPTAQAGIVFKDPARAYELPSSGIDARKLTHSSNINMPGKWLFRIDLPQLVSCPAGRTNPPFCDSVCTNRTFGYACSQLCNCADNQICNATTGQCANGCADGYTGDFCYSDVDECQSGLHRCSAKANCTNLQGGYRCSCSEGFTGDGFFCAELNECLINGVICGDNADCVSNAPVRPSCVCRAGYRGNGTVCVAEVRPTTFFFNQSVEQTAAVTKPTATNKNYPELIFGGVTQSLDPSDNSVTLIQGPHQSTVTQQKAAGTLIAVLNLTAKPFDPTPTVQVKSEVIRPDGTVGNEVNLVDRLQSSGNHTPTIKERKPPVDSASTSNLLVIIIPSILCGVWLILIIVLLVVCLRRRRQKQREKYGLGYYSPPSQESSATKGNSNGAYQHGSVSQWSIPRPTYEYYQGGYYPDPYAQQYRPG